MRITTRQRPSLRGYPWPLRTKQFTTAEIPAYLLGPMPMRGVMEFLYRVSEWSYSGRVVVSNSEPPNFDASISGDLTMDAASDTELAKFKNHRYKFDGQGPYPPAWHNDDYSAFIEPLTTEPIEVVVTEGFEIFHDTELDVFWLRAGFYFFFEETPGDGGYFIVSSPYYAAPQESENIVTVNIAMNSGTFGLLGVCEAAGFISGELTITAKKWHAYATTTGDPAYSTTTGEPINGGPAA
jgi:hypothetical protein